MENFSKVSEAVVSPESVETNSAAKRHELAAQIQEQQNTRTTRIEERDVEINKNNPLIGEYKGICNVIGHSQIGDSAVKVELKNPLLRRDSTSASWELDTGSLPFDVTGWKREFKPLTKHELMIINNLVSINPRETGRAVFKGSCKMRLEYIPPESPASHTTTRLDVTDPSMKKSADEKWELDYDELQKRFGKMFGAKGWMVDEWIPEKRS
ncbi:MAG: hypothetical protein WCG83_05215 [Candidatus Peregrinibacteria bacterium]